jgi:uncharacterized protein YeaO (DUF488 family)
VIVTKPASQAADYADGIRVLVERRWPAGRRRGDLPLDLWLRDVAPSESLRAEYRDGAVPWDEFVRRYRAELDDREDLLRLLRELGARVTVTLLHAARDPSKNHAVALKGVLDERQ